MAGRLGAVASLGAEGKPARAGAVRKGGALPYAAAIVTTGFVALFSLSGNYYDSILVYALCYGVAVVGMVVQVGYSHQLAFHQAVFMMVGAYGVAVLNMKYGVPIWVAIVAVVVGASFVGTLLGAYITRVPNFALALVTLFFSVIATGYVGYNSYLGSETGLGPVAAIWNGASYGSTLEHSGAVVVVLLGVCAFVALRILRSGVGLELALLARDERMAEGVGVLTARRKLELFVFGTACAALGGALFAGTQSFVSPGTFNQTAEVTFLVMLFLGGRASIAGGLIGAVGIEYLSGVSNWVAVNQGIIEGVLITVVLLFFPSGFIGILGSLGSAGLRAAVRLRRSGEGERALPEDADGEVGMEGEAGAVGASGTGEERRGSFGKAEAKVAGLSARSAAGLSGSALAELELDVVAPLEVRGLSKHFGGVRAVNDVSLSIKSKGIVAICGPNGAGKSTLFELIAGGMRPDRGEISLFGVSAADLPAHARSELGVARTLQTVRLMNDRSVLDNVTVAALGSHRSFMMGALVRSDLQGAREIAHAMLRQVGIAHLAKKRPRELTLEAQRMVELARALVAKPRLLLLDEPASGLSVGQRATLAEKLREVANDRTVVLVEHDLEMVVQVAAKVYLLLDGRIAFHGSPQEFVEAEVVRRELMGLIEEGKPLEGLKG